MKALASDFDGTFYFHNTLNAIKDSDVLAIRKLQEQGHLFGFCTGRPIYGIIDYIDNLVTADFYITNSGATIHDKNLNLIFEKTIPMYIIESLITFGNQTSYAIDLHIDGKFYAYQKSTSFISNVLDSMDAITGNVHNISYNALTEKGAQELVEVINQQFGGQITAFRNVQYVDVVPFGCSKGTGIDLIRKTLHPDSFCGIGDSMNDLPMLEKVDVPFTFPYAPETLQEKSLYVVNSVAEAIDFML